MKKILSILMILGVMLSSITPVLAQSTYSDSLPRVQKAIEKMSPSEIINFQQKIADLIVENENQEIKNFLKTILLLTADYKTESVQDIEPIVKEVEFEENITETPSYSQLSESAQRAAEYEISKLQGNLKDETTSLLSQIISSWNSLTNYTEKGSMTAEMNMNIEDFGSATAGMDISEYIAQNQSLDSSFSADISGYFNASSRYADQVEFSGETDLEFIQKEQNTYLLMNNTQMSSSDESIEIELTPMIEKLSELARDNTYISFGNENSFNPQDVLAYFTQDNIESEINMLFSENLMEVYGQNENGYLLRPTKHFCDTGKRLTNVFDPFNGKECSEKQYQNMLEDFMESGVDITLSTGNEVKLSISNLSDVNAYELIDIELTWKNASFHELTMVMIDSYDATEYMNVHYIANDKLQIHVPEQPYDPEFMLDVEFDRYGGIKTIDLTSSFEEEVVFIGNYNNGSLTTSLEIDTPDIQASCSFMGDAYQSYLKVDGGCEISSYLINTDSQTLTIESSILYNGVSSRNDFNWDFQAVSDKDNYLDFNIKSSAQRLSSGSYEIKAPTSTIDYLDFLKEVSPESRSYYDDYNYETNYEYEYHTYDEYDEACYIYDSGDTTCYEYHDNKTVTCNYIAETGKEACDTYEYGYSLEETSFDDFDRVCYNYDSGDRTCYDYYDDKDITCEYLIETDEETCETYEYDTYNYYYDEIEDAEEVKDAMEQ